MMEDEDQIEEVEEISLRDTLEQSYNEATEPETEDAVAASDEAIGDGRSRDDHGRFAAKQEPIGDTDPAAVQPKGQNGEFEGQAPQAEEAQQLNAPQSWKPGAREHWNALPPEVQEEVYRREHGMQQYLNETTEERKLAQAVHQVYAPYEAMIRSEGVDPVEAIDSLFQTAYSLRTGTPEQKCDMIAETIKMYNIPLQMLDAKLAGQVVGAPVPGMGPPPGDPRLDQIMQFQQNLEQALRQTAMEKASREEQAAHAQIGEFSKTHEFLPDVRHDMADLMKLAEDRGVELSMEEAYNRACMLNPEIASVMEQRNRAVTGGTRRSRTARARAAASSVGGAPTKAPRKDPGEMSIREAALQAFEDLAGG